jgi:hypothetical protein
MNNLSWLLYFADVCGNLGVVAVLSWIFSGLFTIFYGMAIDFDFEDNPLKNVIINTWKAIVIITVLCVFLPGKQTIYAIAVSETGEEVLKSNISTKAQQAIEKWIDTQLEDKK